MSSSQHEVRDLVAFDSGAGANIFNNLDMIWNVTPKEITIIGVGPSPAKTTAIGMSIFGRALYVPDASMSLVSQTTIYDQGIEFFLDQDTYVIPKQSRIREDIVFDRSNIKSMYTTDVRPIIEMTRDSRHDVDEGQQEYDNFIKAMTVHIPRLPVRMEAARLHVTTGHASHEYIIQLIERGIIKHTKAPLHELKQALRYNDNKCKCFACMWGKSTNKNPNTHYVRSIIPGKVICADVVFSEHHDGTKAIHHMSIDEATAYIDILDMVRNNTDALSCAHKEVKLLWEVRIPDLKGITLHYDHCTIIESMTSYVTVVGLEQAQPGQHQLIMEGNVRKFRDHIRAISTSLHFIPDSIQLNFLMKWVVHTLNMSYNRVIDDIPMRKVHPTWTLDATTDLTVSYGDLILCNIQKDGSSASKFKPPQQPCIVMFPKMNGSGTVTVFNLMDNKYYDSSAKEGSFKFLPWTDDMEKVAHHVIWKNVLMHQTDCEDLLRPIPDDQTMLPDYFHQLPDTILKQRLMKLLKAFEKAAEKPPESFQKTIDLLQRSMIPEISAAIDDQVKRIQTAHGKRVAAAEARKEGTTTIDTQPNTHDHTPALKGALKMTPVTEQSPIDGPNDGDGNRSALDHTPALKGALKMTTATTDVYTPRGCLEANDGDGNLSALDHTPALKGALKMTTATTDVYTSRGRLKRATAIVNVKTTQRDIAPTTVEDNAMSEESETDQPVPTKRRGLIKQPVADNDNQHKSKSVSFHGYERIQKKLNKHTGNWESVQLATLDNYKDTYASINDAVDIWEKYYALATVIVPNEIDQTEQKEKILQSRMKELKTLIDKKTIHPIMDGTMSVMEVQKRILTRLFTIIKRDGSVKSRAVSGAKGKPQCQEDVVNRWAPTVKFESVFMGLRVALREQRHLSTIDFQSAFLNAPIPKQVTPEGTPFRRILEITPDMVELILQLQPSWAEFVCQGRGKNGTSNKGSIFFVIDRALYGLIEASFAWHTELNNTLNEMGFKQSESDPCVYHSYKNGDKTSIVVYVDDLLIMAISATRTDEIRAYLYNKYNKGVTWKDFNEDDELDYLNVQIRRKRDEHGKITAYELHQTSYANKIIDDLQMRDTKSPFELTQLPYTQDLFKVSSDSKPLDKEESKFYATALGKLLYTSSKVRPLLALPVSFLSKRMKCPTEEDMSKLKRVIFWLREHPAGGLTITDETEEDLAIYVWADASDNCHHDAKGHTGVFISVGKHEGSPIYYMSKVQTLVSRSSTEAELIAVYKAIPRALWAIESLTEWGYPQESVDIFQDNIATILASHDGNKPFSNLSHMNRRFFNCRQYIQAGTIKMPHCDTRSMLADPLTKPMIPANTLTHMRKIIGQDNIENKLRVKSDEEEMVFIALTHLLLLD